MKALCKNQKVNTGIAIFALYLSFCAAGYLTFRGSYAAVMSELGITTAVVANYIVAVFIGGLVPTLLYELISRFLFRFSQARVGGSVDTLMFALRLFYIGANTVIFLIKLVYLWYPLAHIYGDIAIDFVITTAAFVGFLFYALRHVPKERIAPMLYQFGGSYIIVYGVLSLIALMLEVL